MKYFVFLMGLVTIFSTVRGYTSAILDPITLQALMKQINRNLEDSYDRRGELKINYSYALCMQDA